jgi:hypothetical protein
MRCEVLVHHRTAEGFRSTTLTELHDNIALDSLEIDLLLADIYADVQFLLPPEDPDEDE